MASALRLEDFSTLSTLLEFFEIVGPVFLHFFLHLSSVPDPLGSALPTDTQ